MIELMRYLAAAALLTVTAVGAQDADAPAAADGAEKPVLRIATRHVPPFAIYDEQTEEWSGISIELWRMLAADLNVDSTFDAVDLDEMIDGVAEGRYDAAVAALTLTREREQRLDFTHPFYQSGLAIAVPGETHSPILSVLGSMISWTFFQAVGTLALLLAAIGALVWSVERKKNVEEFGGNAVQGLGSGFWWSAVTMTTVGYGDKAPKTLVGRIIGLVWMFASILLISGVTAAIASALTVSQLSVGITGPDDLPDYRVGTVTDSTSAAYLRQNRIDARDYASVQEALRALSTGRVDAVVYDEPVLRYVVRTERGDLRVLTNVFRPQGYGIALPERSPYLETLNRSILAHTSGQQWQELLFDYLGAG